MHKMILKPHYSCWVQKTAEENAKYSRNETMLKVGHSVKAIAHAKRLYAFAKWSV